VSAEEVEESGSTLVNLEEVLEAVGGGGRPRHHVGDPNGKTERQHKLKAMSTDERKAHRKTWKAKQKAKKTA